MFSFNIILTELCNANCNHCYMQNEKHKRTISKNEIDIIINKMPINTKTVIFTGGEIFLVYDLLLYAIEKTREKFANIEIGLESNGIFLYRDFKKAVSILNDLKIKGANYIRFSDDIFHQKGGVDLIKLRNLKDLESQTGIGIKYLIQDRAVAIGKAAKLDEKYIEKRNCMNSNSTLNNPYMFLDVSGNVYPCAWKCVPSIGNMINDSWGFILESLNSDLNQFILSGNIEEALKIYDKSFQSEEIEQYVKKNGQCMACKNNFVN